LGIGYVRPVELRALQILRNLYLKAEKNKFEGSKIIIKMPTAEAFYILNQKRYHINTLEELIRANIKIECDDNMGFPFYEILEDVSINKNVPEAVSLLEKEIETLYIINKLTNQQIYNSHSASYVQEVFGGICSIYII
jgi:hypothetical protein